MTARIPQGKGAFLWGAPPPPRCVISSKFLTTSWPLVAAGGMTLVARVTAPLTKLTGKTNVMTAEVNARFRNMNAKV